jgi:hypothetical protein
MASCAFRRVKIRRTGAAFLKSTLKALKALKEELIAKGGTLANGRKFRGDEAGLPGGLFSSRKSQFWSNSEGLEIENVVIFL